MWDNITPSWVARRESGDVIMNDMMIEKDTFVWDTSTKGSGTRDFGWYDKQVLSDISTAQAYAGLLFPTLRPTTYTGFDNEVALATTRLYAKIQDTPIDLLTSMAELTKSLATINHCFRVAWRLLKAALKLRRLNLQGVIDAGQLANGYLEIRYGIRPIIYDVLGAIEAIEALGKTKRVNLKIRHSIEEVVSNPILVSKRTGSTSLGVNTYYNQTDRTDTYITAGAILDFECDEADVFDEFGIDLIDTAWELIPFSFIVDWFCNIGQVLTSWSPSYAVEVKGTYLCLHEEMRRECYATKQYSYILGAYLSDVSHNGTIVKSERIRRYANPSRPWLPRLNIRLDGLKILDMLAILYGARDQIRKLRM
jgi:hypothetical protein